MVKDFYGVRKMSVEGEEKDETLEELNRQLDEEKREKDIADEVDRRELALKRKEIKPAVFEDKKKKKRQVRIPKNKEHECIFCGETNVEPADHDTIYKIKNRMFSFVFHCKGCGKRQGVTKD